MRMGLCMCVIFREKIVLFSSHYNDYSTLVMSGRYSRARAHNFIMRSQSCFILDILMIYSIFVVFLLLYFLVVAN